MMAFQSRPETTRFLRPEEAHIENAVAVEVLKGAHRTAAGGHVEVEDWLKPRLNPHFLSRLLEETTSPPQGNVNNALP